MITRGIRELVAREWDIARQSKEVYWGERIARLGPVEAFRIGEELRRQVILHNPAWPDAALRQADVDSHARVAALLRRASPTSRA